MLSGTIAAVSLAFAACLSPHTAQAASSEAVQKKLGLLESYLQSRSAEKIDAGNDVGAKELLQQARTHHEQSKNDLAAGKLQSAEDHAREGLRVFSRATMALSRSGESGKAVQQRNESLRREIEGYRQSFLQGLQERGNDGADLLDIDKLENLLQHAHKLTQSGEHRAAESTLREAHAMTVSAITRLRQNDTVVYRLEFRTPADEYRYEEERYRGYEILIEKMQAEGQADGPQGKLVDRFLAEGRRLRDEAAAGANRGDYKSAIGTLEQANKSLIRALQMMGVPISG